MSNFVTRLISNLTGNTNVVAAPTPIATTTTVDSANSTSVQFGFAAPSTVGYAPEQTYADFVSGQARAAGLSLQAGYIAKFVVGTAEYVVDPALTFAELNAKYNTNNEPVAVVVPNPERAVGKNG